MEIISILSGIMLNCINLCSENPLIIVAVALTQAYFPFSQLQCLLLSSVHCLCLPIVSVSSLLLTRHICSYNEKSSAPWRRRLFSSWYIHFSNHIAYFLLRLYTLTYHMTISSLYPRPFHLLMYVPYLHLTPLLCFGIYLVSFIFIC